MASPSPPIAYQVVSLLTWYSRKSDSERRVRGIYNTLDEANAAIRDIYHDDAHRHEGWTQAISRDGRTSYEAKDVGYEESLKLFIERKVQSGPIPYIPPHASAQPGAMILGITAEDAARQQRVLAT